MMKRGLNVGSGQRRFTSTPEIEWCNVDKISRPGHEPDWIEDGAHLPCKDESVDYFVLHHCCEHFQCGEAIGLIQEAHRVLKEGGSLLIFVPNMRALARGWLAGRISTQIYLTNVYGAYMGSPEDTHKWGFDTDSLVAFVNGAAKWKLFIMVDERNTPVNWGIPGADIAQDWWILGMEAKK